MYHDIIICFTCAGFYFIPGALSVEEQCQWIMESLTSFPQPPNRTNHNAIYGPIQDLFTAAKEKRKLLVENGLPEDTRLHNAPEQTVKSTYRWRSSEEHSAGDANKLVLASVLLRKLRWSTLGVQFDWSKVFSLCSLSCIIFYGDACEMYSLEHESSKLPLCYLIC